MRRPHFDIKEINKIIDRNDQKILRGLGFSPERDGRVQCKCPIHGGDNPMGFSYDPHKKKWRCWTNHCHENCEINNQETKVGTGLIGLIRAMKQVSFKDAINIALDYVNNQNIKAPEINHQVLEERIFDKSFLKNLHHNVKAFQDLGISQEILEKYHAFYCTKQSKLYGRACVPIFNAKDDIVGFGGYKTSVLPEDAPKWYYAGGVKLGNHLFGLNVNRDAIVAEDTAILVEGIKDVMRSDQAGISNVVTPFSCNITTEQRKLLVDLKIKNIILAFDPDKAGKKNAARVYDKLKLFFNVVDISPHLPRDPGKMTIEELHKHLIQKI